MLFPSFDLGTRSKLKHLAFFFLGFICHIFFRILVYFYHALVPKARALFSMIFFSPCKWLRLEESRVGVCNWRNCFYFFAPVALIVNFPSLGSRKVNFLSPVFRSSWFWPWNQIRVKLIRGQSGGIYMSYFPLFLLIAHFPLDRQNMVKLQPWFFLL